MTRWEAAEAIADTVLLEGHVLYPYRASAAKNSYRWSFGVLTPPSHTERAAITGSVVIGPRGPVDVRVRFLHRRRRRVVDVAGHPIGRIETPDGLHLDWDESDPITVDLRVGLGEVSQCRTVHRPVAASTQEVLGGRVLRTQDPLDLEIAVEVGSHGRHRVVTLEVHNITPGACVDRDDALGRSALALHALVGAEGVESAVEPPPGVPPVPHDGLWSAVIDERTALLAPMILPDHPAIAPESLGDLCDALEIEELLALRVQTLTPSEMDEARATDPVAAQVLERTVARSATAGLHGATVVLRPGPGADLHDRFLAGRRATVHQVRHDVDGGTHVGVTVDGDPGADLRAETGRFLWFRPDEIEIDR